VLECNPQAREETWFYELPLPEGLKKFSKGSPILDEYFAEARGMWQEWKRYLNGDCERPFDYAAVVIRLALQKADSGHEIFYVATPDTFAKEETLLLEKYYPGVSLDENKLNGFSSPIDSSAVTNRLQFTPSINWRDLITKE